MTNPDMVTVTFMWAQRVSLVNILDNLLRAERGEAEGQRQYSEAVLQELYDIILDAR